MFDEPSAPANKSITTPNHQQQHHHSYSTSYSTASWCRIPSTLSILLCFLFLLSLVQAACAQTEDQGCGEHPLKGILQKLEISRPNLTFEQTTRLLQQVRHRYPRLWRSFEAALSQYTNCMMMTRSGSLG
ncbi:unnamed protein product, partial [Mesorhabditis spiculigera]